MPDEAHAKTITLRSTSTGRELIIVNMINPKPDNINNYRTTIAPADAVKKSNLGFGAISGLRLNKSGGEIEAGYVSKYHAGAAPAALESKINITGGGNYRLVLSEEELPGRVDDIGPSTYVIEMPGTINPTPDNNVHKIISTDLSEVFGYIDVDLVFDWAYMAGKKVPGILYPPSARHVCKDADGWLHVAGCYKMDGIHRAVHIWSSTGGDSWSNEVIDEGGDDVAYVTPSMTIDESGNLHFVYNRVSTIGSGLPAFTGRFYALFAGTTIPDGWTLDSGEGGNYYDRQLKFSDYWGYGGDDWHTHECSYSQGTSTSCNTSPSSTDATGAAACQVHATVDVNIWDTTHLPASVLLKMIYHTGWPTFLPAGIMLFFRAMPASGWTRYTGADNKYFRLKNQNPMYIGSNTHSHSITASSSEDTHGTVNLKTSVFGKRIVNAAHKHIGYVETLSTEDCRPPGYKMILASADEATYTFPADALCMFSEAPVGLDADDWTSMSQSGETLYNKYPIGASTYEDGGGTTTHAHDDYDYTLLSGSPPSGYYETGTGGDNFNDNAHGNEVYIRDISEETPEPAFGTVIVFATENIIYLAQPVHDVFYRFKEKDGSFDSQVNITNLDSPMFQIEATIMLDLTGEKHVVWRASGINPTPTNCAIMYMNTVSGVWQTPVQLSSDDLDFAFPAMDIDLNGDIHVAWCDVTNYGKIQYIKCTDGSWGSIEDVVVDDYVGWISNLICDKDGAPHFMYMLIDTVGDNPSDTYYINKIGGSWNSAECLTTGMKAAGYQQFTGQISIDNKDGIMCVFDGTGFMADYLTKRCPVYRYKAADGTWSPPLDTNAGKMLADSNSDRCVCRLFWNMYPQTGDVYHNFAVSGICLLLLLNTNFTTNTANLGIYNSPFATVGDFGRVGAGGDPGFSNENPIQAVDPSVEIAGLQSPLQVESVTKPLRGAICRSKISQPKLTGHAIS